MYNFRIIEWRSSFMKKGRNAKVALLYGSLKIEFHSYKIPCEQNFFVVNEVKEFWHTLLDR